MGVGAGDDDLGGRVAVGGPVSESGGNMALDPVAYGNDGVQVVEFAAALNLPSPFDLNL